MDKEKDMGAEEKEYDAQGKEKEGGGYVMKGGKLCKKSEDLTGDDLQKSLDLLEDFATAGDTPTRKDTLLAKAASDELTKSEQEELFQILGGGNVNTDDANAGESITKSMEGNQTLKDAIDVSEYLSENHKELVKSLKAIEGEITKSDNRRHEFNLLLAKAVTDIGNMVKANHERLVAFENQPVRAPKSRGAQPLQKSFAGQAAQEDTLTKSEILDTLDGMMEESMAKGMDGRSPGGNDLLREIAKFEQTHMISPKVMQEVKAFRQKSVTH